MAEEIAEAEVVEEGQELAVHEPQTNATLWRTDDPATVLKKASATADVLKPILREKGMLADIDGREYVLIDGWQTLGSMLGVTSVGVWTHEIDGGWEAKVNAQTLDGRVIGSAEAMCLRAEENWADSADYAIRSMAQTRAASKALASVLRFVVTLAGFSGTPAEEMDGVKRNGKSAKGGFASDAQRNFMANLLKEAGASQGTASLVLAYCNATMEGGRGKGISEAIDSLKGDGREAGEKLAAEAKEWERSQSDLPADTHDLPEADAEPQATLETD